MSFLKNIQFQQFANLILLLIIAQLNGTLLAKWQEIFFLALYAAIFEIAAIKFANPNRKIKFFPFSSAVTSFGIVLMLGWLKWYIPYILISLALLQKRLILFKKRHIFNPSNFAVVAALALFYPKALPVVGQIGYQGYAAILTTLLLAVSVLYRANRFIIPIAFILSYILLEYLIIGSTNPNWELTHFLTKFYSTSFIVYIFFMLTDPKTTPSPYLLQAVFGVLTAILITFLDYAEGMRVRNLYLALFITSALFMPLYIGIKNELKKYTALLIAVSLLTAAVLINKPIYFGA